MKRRLAFFTLAAMPFVFSAESLAYTGSRIADEMTVVPAGELSAAAENFLGGKRTAWKDERVIFRIKTTLPENAKLKAFTKSEPIPDRGMMIETKVPARAEYVRSTIGQGGKPVADIVEPNGTGFKIPAGEAVLLVSVDTAEPLILPGKHHLFLDIGGNAREIGEIEVLPATLPPPHAWKIHLDLWQHPEAIARWTGTELWSREHFAAMEPIMKRLADAGQKVITCSVIEEPWDHQTRDHWTSMVKWRKNKAGKWEFDYTAFDKYVDFMMNKIGIREQISCYTMVSWSLKTSYFDEAAGTTKIISLDPKSPDYDATWKAFLTDFRAHLKERDLIEKNCIALDERPDHLVTAAREVVEKYAPELKIVSAVDRPTKMAHFVYDISTVFQHSGGLTELSDSRRKENRKTTCYVCTNPAKPNTFPHSTAAEPHWLLLYTAANRFDGFLRWAYNSWVDNPFADCRWPKRNWPAGDCFLVYPGNRTTLRFETLRDGIEDFEKIRILRENARKPDAPEKLRNAVAELEKYLSETFTVESGFGNAHAEQVRTARGKIDAASHFLK